MLPRPSRLKSVASEFSPVLTTPPPVEPNTVLVLMSVPQMMLSSNFVAGAGGRRSAPPVRPDGRRAAADHPSRRAAEAGRRRTSPWAAAWARPSARAARPGASPSAARRLRAGRLRRFGLAAARRPWAARPWAARDLGGFDLRRLAGAGVSGAGRRAARPSRALAPPPAVSDWRAAGLPLELNCSCRSCNVFSSVGDRASLRFSQRLVARHTSSAALPPLPARRRHLELIASRRRGGRLFSPLVPILPPARARPRLRTAGAPAATLS